MMFWLVTGSLACILGVGAVYQTIGTRRGATRCAPTGVSIDVGGQRLHLVRSGRGRPAVLFEAGIAASSLSWTRVMPAIAADVQVCAYDRAGLGWSDPARAPRTVAQMIAELRGVLASTATPAVLVGHSFGTFLVLAYAAQYPGDVAGLVLLDPPTEWHNARGKRARLLWGGIQLSRLGGVLARVGAVRGSLALLSGGAPGVPRRFVKVFGPAAARTVEHLVGEVRKLPPDVHPLVQELWSQPKCFRAMAEHLATLQDAAAAASRVTSLGDLPIAIVSGGDQPADLIADHRALARVSSRGQHIVAKGSAHWIQLDDPELVVRTIRQVVDQARLRDGLPSLCAS